MMRRTRYQQYLTQTYFAGGAIILEFKINKKDISLDPFEIVAWEDQELAMALFASKPVGEGKKRVHSRLRILIGEEKAVLARIRGEKAALQKARAKMYTLGGLSKEFCRQFALAGRRIFRVGGKAYTELRRTSGRSRAMRWA